MRTQLVRCMVVAAVSVASVFAQAPVAENAETLDPVAIAPVANEPAVSDAASVDQLEVERWAHTPLIPREVLFGDPERVQVRVSPDGAFLSWLAPRDGTMNLWVAPVDDLSKATPVTEARGGGVREHFWAHTGRHIVYPLDTDGDENWRLHVADVRTGRSIDLTPFDGVQARVVGMIRDVPTRVLVGLNRRDPRLHDLYAVDVQDGSLEFIAACPPGGAGWVVDERGAPRFVIRLTPGGGAEWLAPGEGSDNWNAVFDVPAEDLITTHPVAFVPDGQELIMVDSRGRDTAALVAVDTRSFESRVIASNASSDISRVLLHPTTRAVQAVSTSRLRERWRPVDPAITADLFTLERLADGGFHVVSRTEDDRLWVVVTPNDDGPARYWLYDRTDGEATSLFSHQPELEDAPLAPMHPVVIRARDGLELVSYLTLPPHVGATIGEGLGFAGGASVSTAESAPLVLLVHGGPWARDHWGYSPLHQLFANRGYAVLSVNFRGSTGFGKRFVNAGDREWGGAMQDDLVDAVHWAVESGIADPERVAIVGASFGGYASLMGLARDPGLFAAGVSLMGPSNLVSLLQSIPPYQQPLVELWRSRVGDISTSEGRAFLESRSPLTFADRITAPLLLAHGDRDPRVPRAESDAMAEALVKRGLPVTYVVFPDEGHMLSRPSNRLAFFGLVERFLAEHLGGRAEPVADDLERSSGELRFEAGSEAHDAGSDPSPK
ncbi:MAG: S9 family peptidase [Planctomycetota bacterium]